jgi:DNA-binding LacI/PurR family transcriptional regulator
MTGERTSSRATLKEVAQAAGVELSTVSKVLNGGSIAVRSETRARIEAAAAQLQYRPNASARGLKLQRTAALGFLLPDVSNPVYAAIVRGAMREATRRDYALLLAELRSDSDDTAYLRLAQESRIDGLIIANARESEALGGDNEWRGIPQIAVNRRAPHGVSVFIDDEAGAALAASTLIEAGHRRLGLITGPSDIDTAIRRERGFRLAVAAAGLPEPLVATGDYTTAGGATAMRRLLSGDPAPTAVFVSNFMACIGALHVAVATGLRVPDDLSIISFDEPDIAPYLTPSLTAVKLPYDDLGVVAVEAICDVLEGKEAQSRMIAMGPDAVVFRDSVATVRAARGGGNS